jgi:hypothetical protein
MIKVGEKLFEKKSNILENLETIKEYLSEQHLIIVDKHHKPLDEEEILEFLVDENPVFLVKEIYKLEKETIEENIFFINQIKKTIEELISDPKEASQVYKVFIDIIEVLTHLERIGSYFTIEVISKSNIETISIKGLEQMELYNDSYILELIEYECLPMLISFKNKLEERELS